MLYAIFHMAYASEGFDRWLGHQRKTSEPIRPYFPVPHFPVPVSPTEKCRTEKYESMISRLVYQGQSDDQCLYKNQKRDPYAYAYQKTIPHSVAHSGFGGRLDGAARASPAQARRRRPLARSPRSANLARRPVGGLRRLGRRCQRGQGRLASLGGQLRRQGRTPDDARPRELVVAALE